ncbi:EamA family transporter [Mycolicibacterium hodleri]|uniref:EamA family transporter n=1 Tax=Mycolicibacterium hodleri TaxID=49897 RepID=A0A502DS43_9MYCO|nr:EamA family transporter [Mycolicibacterium hodleri]TPG27369.1 EamA family transporter [Mycolicibacterium hodleri]
MTAPRRRDGTAAGPALLVVAAATSQEVGAAFAVGLFGALGVGGATFARFAVAGAVLCIAVRPRVRHLTRRAWGAAAALAISLAAMNLCFYGAISRIPLGIAVTIEVLGPLVLSVALSRRGIAWVWALLAFAGIAALGVTPKQTGHLDLIGVAFAAAAAVSWAAYIAATSQAVQIFPRLDALAIATAIGALLVAPLAVVTVDAEATLHWHIIALAIAVGLMSSVLPYSLELWSLRTLQPGTFAVLTCLSPVVAVLAGWAVLDQSLRLIDCVAIVLVTLACVGAMRSSRRPRRQLPP